MSGFAVPKLGAKGLRAPQETHRLAYFYKLKEIQQFLIPVANYQLKVVPSFNIRLCCLSSDDVVALQSWDFSGHFDLKQVPRKINTEQEIKMEVSDLMSRLEDQ